MTNTYRVDVECKFGTRNIIFDNLTKKEAENVVDKFTKALIDTKIKLFRMDNSITLNMLVYRAKILKITMSKEE